MKKYTYDASKYKFRELVSNLFGVSNLEKIHELKRDWIEGDYDKPHVGLYKSMNEVKGKNKVLPESNSTFHSTFYKKLNDNWIELYEAYDEFIHNEIIPIMDERFHYQYLPSFRVQLPNLNHQAVYTWHFDSDNLHRHPKGEINFFLPLTKAYGTNTIWIESEPYKLDFKPLEANYGEFWSNNGNVCMHGNKPNITTTTRMSFDFRIIPLSKYNPNYSNNSAANSKKFLVGHYYKELKN